MNKLFTKLLSIALLFFSWASVQGQIFVLNENFNGTTGNTPPAGWSNNTLVGQTFDKWSFDNPGGQTLTTPISSPAAIFDSDWYSGGGGAEDVTLESPSINTIGKPAITLKFDHQFEAGFGGRATVEVWNGSIWTEVYNTTGQVNTTTESINITALAANRPDVKVRFRWRGNYSWWWMIDNVQMFYIVDVQTVSVDAPTSPCGDANDSIKVTVRNNSAFTIKNIPVKVQLSGGLLSGTKSATIDSIEASSTKQVTLVGGNTTAGGTLNVTAYTELTGDNTKTNDTTKFSLTVIGTPADPTVTVGSRCGVGSVRLSANTSLTTDSIVWYENNPPTGLPVGLDRVLQTPTISGTRDFYAAAVRGDITPQQLSTFFPGGNGNTGTMFDVIPQKGIVIDSLTFTEFTSASGTYVMRVYYKEGTYVGFNNNPGAWTTIGDYSVTSAGNNAQLKFDIDDTRLAAGKTYGMYITIISGPSNSVAYTNGNNTYSDANLRIETGIGTGALFPATFNNPRSWNGTIHYKLQGCISNLVAVKATVNPVAAGTTLAGKMGSKGTFNGGILTTPDVNASPDSIMYDLVTPTGFNNADYGSAGTWEVSSITATTKGGIAVPASMYSLVNPTSLTGGVFRLHTDTTFTDSVLKVDVNVRRLDNGCDTTITKYVYIAARPKARFNAPEVCEDDITLFDNGSYLQTGTLSYKWKFGQANAESDLANPFYKYRGSGTYNVTLIAESDYGYKDSVTQTITINENPIASFEITNACEGTAVRFRDASVLPSGTPTYSWDFGDSNTGNTDNETNLYNLPGIYKVRMIVEVGGCSDELTKYATQAPRSKPDFGFTALQCDNTDVTFTNNTTKPSFGTVAYTWKLGDGTEENRVNLKYTYNAFKTYDVVLIGRTDLGCIDSISKSITLKESPIVDFNIVGSICSNESLTFDNITTLPAGIGTVNTYEWAFGDANTSTNISPIHQYVGPGVKTITLIARNSNGCEGSTSKDITINLKPNADFVAKDVCLGTETVFSNNSSIGDASALTYEWIIDGNTTTNTNESITFTADGAKNVRLVTTSKDNCTDTANRTIEVFPQPLPVISIASQLSFDGAFNFATNTQGASYKWLLGDGAIATTQNTTYKYPIDGTYEVRLIITSDKGCIGIDRDTIVVNRLSVDEFLNGNVKLYPNPGNGAFDIEFTDINTNVIKSVVVLNNLGQKVAMLDIKDIVNNKLAIDIANEAAGIYFIQVETTSGKASFKYNLVK